MSSSVTIRSPSLPALHPAETQNGPSTSALSTVSIRFGISPSPEIPTRSQSFILPETRPLRRPQVYQPLRPSPDTTRDRPPSPPPPRQTPAEIPPASRPLPQAPAPHSHSRNPSPQSPSPPIQPSPAATAAQTHASTPSHSASLHAAHAAQSSASATHALPSSHDS